MDNEMIVEALHLFTDWLYQFGDRPTHTDCEQYLETHEAQARSLTHAMIVIVDICKQFREGGKSIIGTNTKKEPKDER